jgi:hypothetical protein
VDIEIGRVGVWSSASLWGRGEAEAAAAELDVLQAVDAELGGGPPTGFFPARTDGTLTVSFTSVVVHAARP